MSPNQEVTSPGIYSPRTISKANIELPLAIVLLRGRLKCPLTPVAATAAQRHRPVKATLLI